MVHVRAASRLDDNEESVQPPSSFIPTWGPRLRYTKAKKPFHKVAPNLYKEIDLSAICLVKPGRPIHDAAEDELRACQK
jgi:hypothetical protein